jgi:methionyl-tRNA formyltransferase
MGSDEFSLPVLSALAEAGPGPELATSVEVVGVVTRPDRPAGRGRRLSASPPKAFADRENIPVLQPERVRRAEEVDRILALRPDLIVVASFGQILPARLLDEPSFGSLNLHPSLLPRYRGPSPIVAPILAGDGLTGTTLMLMATEMDAGPILRQVATPIGDKETAGELTTRLAELSARLLLEALPDWVEGRIEPVPQEDEAATYTRILRKEDGEIEWDRSAQEIARMVRAFNPWPSAYTGWEGRRIRMLRASAADGEGNPGAVARLSGDALEVGTGSGVLRVTELQLAGGRPISAGVLARGHPGIVGARLG